MRNQYVRLHATSKTDLLKFKTFPITFCGVKCHKAFINVNFNELLPKKLTLFNFIFISHNFYKTPTSYFFKSFEKPLTLSGIRVRGGANYGYPPPQTPFIPHPIAYNGHMLSQYCTAHNKYSAIIKMNFLQIFPPCLEM